MGHYLLNFSVYTIAMVGFIFIALFVFKSCTCSVVSKKSSMLNVVDSMKLSARKTLYVIEAGSEKFLIAADIDSTSLIAKLDGGKNEAILKHVLGQEEIKPIRKDRTPTLGIDKSEYLKSFASTVDFKRKSTNEQKNPMMKELLMKLDK